MMQFLCRSAMFAVRIRRFMESARIYKELCEVIPGGVNSPVRSCREVGQNPLVAASAKGDMIYDVDGRGFIDYCCSWGPLIHGHSHPEILDVAKRRMELGTTFGVTTPIEGILVRKIIQHMPWIDKLRFVSSGTEATMTAARLARGYTGRKFLVKFSGNYHGHADFFLVQAGSGVFGLNPSSTSAGIPEEIVKHTVCLTYNDIAGVEAFLDEKGDEIAALIIEPVSANMGVVPPAPGFLQMLRKKTAEKGIVFIIDEVITGFRIGRQGAQGYYGVEADLTCLGKIVGGGFPAAAFGGKRAIMDCLAPLGSVYQAGTLSGNPVAMEAGLKTIELLEKPGFYEGLKAKADIILKPVQQAVSRRDDVCIQSVESLFTLFFGKKKVDSMKDGKELDTERYAKFFRYMFDAGIYIPPSQYEAWFVSNAHTEEHLAYTRDKILTFLHTDN